MFFLDHIPGAQDIKSKNFLPLEVWMLVHDELRRMFKKKWNAILKIEKEAAPLYVFPKSKPRITTPTLVSIDAYDECIYYVYIAVFIKNTESIIGLNPYVRIELVWEIYEHAKDDACDRDLKIVFIMRVHSRYSGTRTSLCSLPMTPSETLRTPDTWLLVE